LEGGSFWLSEVRLLANPCTPQERDATEAYLSEKASVWRFGESDERQKGGKEMCPKCGNNRVIERRDGKARIYVCFRCGLSFHPSDGKKGQKERKDRKKGGEKDV
jgi:ribosomal protein L37AE/L43A